MVSRFVLVASVLLLCVAGAAALADPEHTRGAGGALQPSAADAVLLPYKLLGEGDKCGPAGKKTGTCTARGCPGGTMTRGLCQGPTAVQCCTPGPTSPAVIPFGPPAVPVHPAGPVTPAPPAGPAVPLPPFVPGKALQMTDHVRSGAEKFPGTELAFPWPAEYTFPYAPNRHVVSDFSLQRIRLYDGAKMIKEWKMSSGKLGIGFTSDVAASPAGKFKIFGKVGRGAALGTIFEKQKSTGRIGKASDKFAHMQTRLLLLEGLDAKNKNTRQRSIYIHGTNRAEFLGTRQSHGCFRMRDADVVELESLITVPTFYWAVPFNAWP